MPFITQFFGIISINHYFCLHIEHLHKSFKVFGLCLLS
jgi:hypothetical protein